MYKNSDQTPFRTILIIPAYNEEGCIERVINKVKVDIPDIDYVVVNDGSRDSTLEILIKNKYNYIDLPVNLGLHGAIQTGLIYAHINNYDCAIQFDGDGQHRTEYVQPLVKAIQGKSCDVAIGSRFAECKRPHSIRMIGSRFISLAIFLITGKNIYDPTSGMRAYNKELIELLATNSNYGPEPDTVSYLLLKKKKIIEIQVEMDERISGVSYLGISASIKYMARMLTSILLIQPFR